MSTLRETIETAIKNQKDLSEEFYVGKDLFDVSYDAEYGELTIETFFKGQKHNDADDLVIVEGDDWTEYEAWNWPEGEAKAR